LVWRFGWTTMWETEGWQEGDVSPRGYSDLI
jgi:hypothetical protein